MPKRLSKCIVSILILTAFLAEFSKSSAGIPQEHQPVKGKSLHIKGGFADLKSKTMSWLRIGNAGHFKITSQEIRRLAIGPQGSLWIATNKGLSRLTRNEIYHFTGKNLLPADHVFDILSTKRGIVAATKGGLVWIDALGSTTQNREPLATGFITSVVFEQEGPKEKLWYLKTQAGKQSILGRITFENGSPVIKNGAYIKNESEIKSHRIRQILPGGEKWLLCQDNLRDWHWYSLDESAFIGGSTHQPILTSLVFEGQTIALTQKKILLLQPGTWDWSEPFEENIGEGHGTLALNPGTRSIWLGRTNKLWKLDIDRRQIKQILRLPENTTPNAIAKDFLGRLWIGTNNGLLMTVEQKKTGQVVLLEKEKSPKDGAHERLIKSQESSRDISRATSASGAPSALNQKQSAQPDLEYFNPQLAGFSNDGRIWCIKDNYLFVENQQNDSFKRYDFETAVLDAHLGEKWFVWTEAGIFKKDNGKFVLAPHIVEKITDVTPEKIREHFEKSELYKLKSQLKGSNFARRLLDGKFRIHEENTRIWDKEQYLDMLDDSIKPEIWPFLFNGKSFLVTGKGNKIVTRTGIGSLDKIRIFDAAKKASIVPIEILPQIDARSSFSIQADPDTRDMYVMAGYRNDLFRISRELSLEKITGPWANYGSISFHVMGKTDKLPTRLIALDRNNIWEKHGDEGWKVRLAVAQKQLRPIISSILPDAKGKGMFVGCWECGKDNLFYYTDDHLKKIEIQGMRIGGFNHAIVRDRHQRLWVPSDNGIWLLEKENDQFNKTKILGGVEIYGAIEGPGGRIWITDKKAVGFIDKDLKYKKVVWPDDIQSKYKAAEKEARLRRVPVSLGLYAPAGNELPKLWVGGVNILVSINPVTNYVSNHLEDLYKLIQKRSGESLYTKNFVSDGNSLLILTNEGLFSFSNSTFKKINLPAWPQDPRWGMDILKLEHGSKAGMIIVSAQTTKGFTRLWTKSKNENEFKKIKDYPEKISTLSQNRHGEIIFGTNDGKLLLFEKNQLSPLWNVRYPESDSVISPPFIGFCPVGESEYIILTKGSGAYLFKPDQENPVRLEFILKPWKQYAHLPEKRILLLHDDGALTIFSQTKIDSRPDVHKNDKMLKLTNIQSGKVTESPGTIWFLSEKSIWHFDSADELLKKVTDLPAELTGLAARADFKADEGGFWIGTDGVGLWRYSKKSKKWDAWDDIDGLPSRMVNAISARSKNEAVIFTVAGASQATRVPQKEALWQFGPPQLRGVIGTQMHIAGLFKLEDRDLLFIGTNQGISIVHCKNDNWAESHWFHVSTTEGLHGKKVTALCWNEANRELWVGTDEGVTSFNLGIDDDSGSISMTVKDRISAAKGLPAGQVTGISATDLHAWILVANQLCRWDQKKEQVVCMEPYLFLSAEEIILGPVISNHKLPRLLLLDNGNKWSIWNPFSFIHPKLNFKDRFIGLRAELELDSLNPNMEILGKWKIQYAVDRVDKLSSRSFRITPNLFSYNPKHYLVAEVKPLDGKRQERYLVSVPIIEHRSSFITRVIILLGLLLFFIILLFFKIRNRIVRAEKVRERVIPYVSGQAIADPTMFFGREKLIKKLASTVSTNSYALTGEWRIGKSSIQHQLKRQLETGMDPEYVYFPTFMDLSKHGSGKDELFFYFLGEHLVQLGKEKNVPEKILQRLQFYRCESPNTYSSQRLERDIQRISKYWSDELAPRKPIIVFQIDESSFLETFKYDTLLKFRSIFVNQESAQVVLSGKSIPPPQSGNKLSPWSNFMHPPITILPLKPEEQKKLITEPVKRLFYFSNDVLEEICARSGGKPNIIQGICIDILTFKYEKMILKKRITLKDLHAIINQKSTQEAGEK